MDNIEKKLDVLFELEKYREVLELSYETLYASESDKELLYQYIILSHMNLEEFQKALTMCDEALGEYPNIGTFFYLRSKTLYFISSYKKAFSDIQEALVIEPNEARYLAHYAKLYLIQDNYIQAKEMIERALELDSSVSEYHLTLAVVLYMLDGQKIAREIVDDVLAKEPHNIEALTLKQKLFTSKLKEKKSLLQNLLFLDPFDKENQKEIKFIKYYYKFIPAMMVGSMVFSYLVQSGIVKGSTFDVLSIIVFVIVGIIGSNEWRLNLPYIIATLGLNNYTHIHLLTFGDVIAILILSGVFHYFFLGLFLYLHNIVWEKLKRRISWMKD